MRSKDKLIKARVKLLQDHPFFARLAMFCNMIPAPWIETCAIDAKGNFYYNEKFIAGADPQEDLVFVFAHEVSHLITLTHKRLPVGASHRLWNIASDIVINKMLTDSGIDLCRAEFLKVLHERYNSKLEKYDKWITEKIYRDLFDEAQKNNQCTTCGGKKGEGKGKEEGGSGTEKDMGSSSSACPDCGSEGGAFGDLWFDDSATRTSMGEDGTGEDSMTQQQAAEWKKRISSAAAAAKSAGKMPGALEEWVGALLQPKKDWKKYLRFSCSSALKGDWTWKRPGRRTMGTGIRTPGRNPNAPTAVIAIDTSGSMGKDELRRCLSESSEIIKQCGGQAHLILHDCVVYYSESITDDALTNLKIQQGGTDFRPIFEEIKNLDEPPKILIAFTDLCGPFPEVGPDFKVVWCVPMESARASGWSSGRKAPFGDTIEVELE